MSLDYWAVSQKGSYHKDNEDKVFSLDELDIKEYALFLLSDGVGGYAGGKIASNLAINIFSQATGNLLWKDHDISKTFYQTLMTINNKIRNFSLNNPLYPKLACTLVGLLILPNEYHCFSIGDSRIYLRDKSGFKQITEDDSLAWQRYKKGMIKKNDILLQIDKNIITKAIGLDSQVFIHYYHEKLNNYFQFLLCSDGLSDYLSDDEIEKVLSTCLPLKDKSSFLVKRALEEGSNDDISLIIVENNFGK